MRINCQLLIVEIIFYIFNLFTFVASFVFLKNFEDYRKFGFEDYVCIVVCLVGFVGCMGSLIRSKKILVLYITSCILIAVTMLGALGNLMNRYHSFEDENSPGTASTKLAIDLSALLIFGMVMQTVFAYFIVTELKRNKLARLEDFCHILRASEEQHDSLVKEKERY